MKLKFLLQLFLQLYLVQRTKDSYAISMETVYVRQALELIHMVIAFHVALKMDLRSTRMDVACVHLNVDSLLMSVEDVHAQPNTATE